MFQGEKATAIPGGSSWVSADVGDLANRAAVGLPPEGAPGAAETGGAGKVREFAESRAAVGAEAELLALRNDGRGDGRSEPPGGGGGGLEVRGSDPRASHPRAPDLAPAELNDGERGGAELARGTEGGAVGEDWTVIRVERKIAERAARLAPTTKLEGEAFDEEQLESRGPTSGRPPPQPHRGERPFVGWRIPPRLLKPSKQPGRRR